MVDVQGCLEGDRLPLARMHVSNVEGCRVKCRGMPGPSVVGQLQCSSRRQAGRQGVVKERKPVAVDIVTGRLLRAPGA